MTDTEKAVVEILAQSDRPIGWYNISIRLGMRGVQLEERLPDLLQRLQVQGFLRERTNDSARQEQYEATRAGMVAAGLSDS